MSTQEGFGRILADLAREGGPLADRIVTTSPDVAVSTNLGGWVNRRGLFNRHRREDVFSEQKVVSAQRWMMSPQGQHIELGIAENNLFILLAALGLSHSLFGVRLLPIGTLYDPFIMRGLDALNYACYQDARFLLVATPSGITLAPEGGAHQSVGTPLIGLAQDGLAAFEPAFVDELATIMDWSFDYLQRDGSAPVDDSQWFHDVKGGSVYLRLSTRTLAQPERSIDDAAREAIIAGGYWLKPPAPGARLALVYTGAIAARGDRGPPPDPRRDSRRRSARGDLGRPPERRLARGRARPPGRPSRLASPMSRSCWRRWRPMPAWSRSSTAIRRRCPGSAACAAIACGPLGVEHFGQSGDIPDLFERYRIDAEAILDACAAVCLRS